MASIGERLRLLVRMPWQLTRFWRALGAWQRRDWPRIISLLQPIAGAGLQTSGDSTLLGIAFARESRFREALWHFEQVDLKQIFRFEEPFYANNYAYTLARVGRLGEAQRLLRSFSRDRWPAAQRRWALESLAAVPPGSAPLPGDLRLHRYCQ